MSAENYELRTLNLNYMSDRNTLDMFLKNHDLQLESDIDYALCLEDEGNIIASGCSSGNVLKCIAVSHDYQGQSITNTIMTYLRLKAYHEGITSLFLYTKPENENIFTELGFYPLASSPDAILMENNEQGCSHYVSELMRPKTQTEAAAIVMNCNPFTLGHRYLIEKACSENPAVHLFILKEDLSVFPFEDRINLVKKGTKDLENLYIHEGKDYIISRATFPSYFLKEKKILNENHALLDLDLFSKRIAPALNIGNIILAVMNISLAGLLVRVLSVPPKILYPIVLGLSFAGAHAISYSVMDFYLLVGFGLLGYFMSKSNFPSTPMILAVIVGNNMEQSFRRAYKIADGDIGIFFGSPIGLILFALTLISILYPMIKSLKVRLQTAKA